MYRLDAEQCQAIYDRVKREYTCAHSQTALTVKVGSNGSRSYRKQCLRCGEIVEPIAVRTLDPSAQRKAAPFDDQLRFRWNEASAARYQVLMQEAKDREQREWDRWYSEYLLSPQWRHKRSLVLARAGGQCEGCRQQQATQVHHLTYQRAGCEMLFDLVAVCDGCHDAIHADRNPSA